MLSCHNSQHDENIANIISTIRLFPTLSASSPNWRLKQLHSLINWFELLIMFLSCPLFNFKD
ncbi:hypothetical protein [Acinetobacter phage Ab69]|nr:hypothetical protein [Acinetobacter phage Ab69]